MAMLLLAALTRSTAAGPIEDASAAYNRGDYNTTLRILRPLAEHGVAEAEREVGFMYYRGEGVPQNYIEAVKWFRAAAEQGFVSAQHDLGVMYLNGQGVTQDYVLAHMWFNLAASHTSKNEDRESVVKDRDSVASKMTPEQIAEAQKLAREWKPEKNN